MAELINLAERMREQLPADTMTMVARAGEIAERQQQRLYLVGGAVRDLMLGRGTVDIDFVVEGDAIRLAEKIGGSIGAKVTTHPRFGTARLDHRKGSADLATARAESYDHPGALPTVRPGTIADDLARRDFTVNAMAVEINPRRFGELIDPHGGRDDLGKKSIRVLHAGSFTDDATRIWRAIRYEQRLGFQIGASTLSLLKRDVHRLKTISGDRVRHEFKRALQEEFPERTFVRADELGVLSTLHPSLKGDDWLVETFGLARERSLPERPHPELYLALLAFRLKNDESRQFSATLKLPKALAQVVTDTIAVKDQSEELAVPGLAPSAIYRLLHGYSLVSLTANALATGSPTAAGHIELYLNVLRYVNPALNGSDLKRLGFEEGPQIKDILRQLREARLDGRVNSREDEVRLAEGFSNHSG